MLYSLLAPTVLRKPLGLRIKHKISSFLDWCRGQQHNAGAANTRTDAKKKNLETSIIETITFVPRHFSFLLRTSGRIQLHMNISLFATSMVSFRLGLTVSKATELQQTLFWI